MGLPERRAQKEFIDNVFPALKAEVTKAAGYEMPIEVDWETLTLTDMSHLYRESWPKVYFEPLVDALKAICIDDMGKEALKSKLKKVVIQNKHSIYYGDRWASWDDPTGTLTLDHEPCTNVDNMTERKEGAQKLLESKL